MKRIFLHLFLFLLFVPVSWAQNRYYVPNVQQGEKLYQRNCSSCHGARGLADTATANALIKKPVALGDLEVLSKLTPEKVFTIMTQGAIENGMPSFKAMSIQERWDVAAYVFTLHPNFEKPTGDVRPTLTWDETKSLSDVQIMEIFRKRAVPESSLQKELSCVRYLPE
jgi:cytochrome c553